MIPQTNIFNSEGHLCQMLSDATRELFSSMLGAEASFAPASAHDFEEPFDGVVALIGLTGAVIGNAEVMASPSVACDLSSRFLMTEFSTVDEQVLDAIGELTNMIVGGFKNLIEPELGPMQMSTPSIVSGKNICARNQRTDVRIYLRCLYEGGEIGLQVGLTNTADNRP